MWNKIKNWFKSVFSKENGKAAVEEARQAVVTTASETVNSFVNDPANQAAAFEAVKAVATKGLGNNKALDAAVALLKERGIAAGLAAANTLLRTLVQIVYASLKLS